MSTLGDLQQEVLLQLEGYVNDLAVVATLSSALTDSATSISTSAGGFPDGSGLSPGVWEVGDELVLVTSFNRSTGVGSGVVRGWRGSTAQAHASGSLVRGNPRFPLVQVSRAINDTVRNLYPRVPAVKFAELTVESGKSRYVLPDDAKNVIGVSARATGDDEDAWVPLPSWVFVPSAGGSAAGSPALDVFATFGPGLVRVTYTAEPAAMSAASDSFESVSGLPAFAREAVVWGAMWRLYSMVELGRGQWTTADQTLLNTQEPIGKPTDLAKYLLGMFGQAVDAAEVRVRELYPAVKHYVW